MQIYSIKSNYRNYKFYDAPFSRTKKAQFKLNKLSQDTVSFSASRSPYKLFTLLEIKERLQQQFFPEKVWEAVNKKIITGQIKTPLVKIHRRVYAGLLKCKTLDEAKALYPEFKDVIDLKNFDLPSTSRTTNYLLRVKNGDFIDSGINQENFSLLALQKIYAKSLSKKELNQLFGADIINHLAKLNIYLLPKEYVEFLYRTKVKFSKTRKKLSKIAHKKWTDGTFHGTPASSRQLPPEEVEKTGSVVFMHNNHVLD